MSKTKTENNKPSKYQELNDFELEVVCGGNPLQDYDLVNGSANDSTPETINIKSEAA